MQNSKKPVKLQPTPEYPWQFVSQDLCKFESGGYVVTSCHYSDFIKVNGLDNTLSSTIAAKTETQITCHGILETILTDNDPSSLQLSIKGFVKNATSSTSQAHLTGHKTMENRKPW